MNRITPTGYAEEHYQANLNAKFDKAMRRGPSGVMIPPARQLFRKTVDGPLLMQIRKVAFADYRSSVLTRERLAAVAASFRANLLSRFPVDDMRVLERYGFARMQDTAWVEIFAHQYESEKIALGEEILLPGVPQYHVDLGGRGSSTGPPAPADTIAYFRDVVAVRREDLEAFTAVHSFPGQFRQREGRWPRWQEIERAYPRIGEWMEGQRA